MPKRRPIEYTRSFGGGIFRPPAEVEQELAMLEADTDQANPLSERTFDRSDERSNERPKTRHSFDVFSDQIKALTAIQSQIFNRTGKKPKLGELVQQALDDYIRTHDDRTNDRSVDRSRDQAGT